ncbi:tripartite tricarboxylate transporter permease [Oceanibaculum pacificum]|uniref:Tat pathway signal protein n=1 Tax=Oceanibaculum pacificum TaxID=580166 RepID=A0A154W3M5_9PROT|nr:tripartite tricarboxylate transporter permease [Oceanibaculum pacificum]KZD08150.1 Tat pathway signal protein [Oceanibaculum pacificum]
MLENLLTAFGDVFALHNLALMAGGVACGLIAGSIPGFTITMAVVLTLPFTFGMSPVEGLSTMLGVYVGGLTGGMFASALIGIPGTPSAISTTFDGFPMARKGRPGLALGLGLWSSFMAGILSAIVLVFMAPTLAAIGLEFGPWDYFTLVCFALTIAASLSDGALIKGLIAGVFGMVVAAIGEDAINGAERMTFGIDTWRSGFDFLPVLIGLFAFSQLLSDLRDKEAAKKPMLSGKHAVVRMEHLESIRLNFVHWITVVRASAIGLFIGLLPAAGSSISNILAYDQEKKASKHPEKFGTGVPEGVIASEASNNATAGGALIMMMALGIPGDAVTAVMLGALTIHNIAPSPTFISTQPKLAYAIMVAYFLANFMTLAMTSGCLRVFMLVTRVPLYILSVVILGYCAIGVFTLNNVISDIWTLLLFGVIGFVMQQRGFPLTPMVLGVVLGPVAELNLSRAIATSDDLTLFVTRPWALFFVLMAVFSVFFPLYQKARERGQRWSLYYGAAFMASVAVPLIMMGGWFRTGLGIALLLGAAALAWRRSRHTLTAS